MRPKARTPGILPPFLLLLLLAGLLAGCLLGDGQNTDSGETPDVQGHWMATIERGIPAPTDSLAPESGENGDIVDPSSVEVSFLYIEASGDSFTVADACNRQQLMARGHLIDGAFSLFQLGTGAVLTKNGVVTPVSISYETQDQDSAFWSLRRIEEPVCFAGEVDPTSVEFVVPSQRIGDGAGSGLANLRAAEWARLPIPATSGENRATGDPMTTCNNTGNDDTVACPASGQNRQGVIQCQTQGWTESEIRTLANRAAFVDDANMFPGAVLQGKRFAAGDFVLVNAPRAGGRIVLSGLVLNPGTRYSRDVDDMRGSDVQEAIADILSGGVQATAANYSYELSDAHSVEQMMFKFGVDGRYGGASMSASLDLDQETRQNTVVMKFTQIFYNVSYEIATGEPYVVFRDGEAFADPSSTIGADNPPLYIANVSYGRQVFLAVRSTYSSQDIRAALSGAYNGLGGEVSGSASTSYSQIMSSSEITLYVRGGSAGLAVAPLIEASSDPDKREGLYQAVRNLLANKAAAEFSPSNPGLPIAYSANYLVDRSRAQMGYSVVYDKNSCELLPANAYFIEFNGWDIDDDLYVWMDQEIDASRKLYTNNRSGGSVNLTQALGNAASGKVIIRLGNGGCFGTSGEFEIKVDGSQKWHYKYDPGGWRDCGWQVHAEVEVNKNTGQVTQTYFWKAH